MKNAYHKKGEEVSGVSIIVPAKNEEKYIGICLDSLLNQTFNGPLEIIVVDNLSSDRTVEIAISKQVHVVTSPENSPAAVRNYGASEAKYPILAFIDADCTAPYNWLSCAVLALESNDLLGAVGGPCFAPASSNWVEQAWAPLGSVDHTSREDVTALAGSNLFVRKNLFESIGGFDNTLITAEDDEFCQRILRDGYRLESMMECAIIHYGYPQTLMELLMKSYWHGTTQLRAHGLMGDKLVILTLVWILFFLVFLFSLILCPFYCSISLLIMLFILPGLLAFARLKRNSLVSKLIKIVPTYVVCLFVVMGRAAGMAREILFDYVGFGRLFRW